MAPDFRGRNDRPEACASPLAIHDVMDAVAYARQHAHIDDSRMYVMGGSGGGHMTLMMSTHAPNVWAATSAWVPISDLSAWYAETNGNQFTRYATMMETICGGPPNAQTEKQYRARSPLFYLDKAKGLPMDINTGIHDGHTGSVPVSHALHAFNRLAEVNGNPEQQVAEADITHMVQTQKIPEALSTEKIADPERRRAVLFRRIAGPVRITVFAGGHEFYIPAALNWLSRQSRGKAANFQLGQNIVPKKDASEVPP
jgi:acetyl esterase/lipase